MVRATRRDAPEHSPSWRERIAALRYVPPLLKLVWQTHRGYTVTMGQEAMTLLSMGAALFVFSPWLLLLLVVAVLPSFWGETHFAALQYSLLFRWTPERRQLDYIRFLGAGDRPAKEVQMFGLASWLIERGAERKSSE